MADILNFEELKKTVKEELKASFLKISASNQGISGFSICTDDSVMTIYSSACTSAWFLNPKNKAYLYSPVEWDCSDSHESFPGVYDLLMARVERQEQEEFEDEFEEIADSTFKSFVSAIEELKNERVFPTGLFLNVISTDPSPHMLKLERRAIYRLNSLKNIALWEIWRRRYG